MYEAGESFGIDRTDDLREAHLFKTNKDAEFFMCQNPYVKKSDTVATNILSRTFCLPDSTIEGMTKNGFIKESARNDVDELTKGSM